MRLSPPISVLTLIGVTLAVIGIGRAGGECVLSSASERASPAKLLRWVAAMIQGNAGSCDILTFENSGGAAEVIAVRQGSGNWPDHTMYSIYLARDGSSVVEIAHDASDGSTKARQIRHGTSNMARAKFIEIVRIIAPLRAQAVEETQENMERNFSGEGGTSFDGKIVGHRCLRSVTDIPGDSVEFWPDPAGKPLIEVAPSWCIDMFTLAAKHRIELATKLAFDAADFHPTIAPTYFP